MSTAATKSFFPFFVRATTMTWDGFSRCGSCGPCGSCLASLWSVFGFTMIWSQSNCVGCLVPWGEAYHKLQSHFVKAMMTAFRRCIIVNHQCQRIGSSPNNQAPAARSRILWASWHPVKAISWLRGFCAICDVQGEEN